MNIPGQRPQLPETRCEHCDRVITFDPANPEFNNMTPEELSSGIWYSNYSPYCAASPGFWTRGESRHSPRCAK